jgi:hypothetical protein
MNSKKQTRIDELRNGAAFEMSLAAGAEDPKKCSGIDLRDALAAAGITPTHKMADELRKYCTAFEPRKIMSPAEIVKLLKGI